MGCHCLLQVQNETFNILFQTGSAYSHLSVDGNIILQMLRMKPCESYIQFIRTSCQFYLQNMPRVCPLLTSSTASTLVPAILCPNDYSGLLADFPAFIFASLVYSQHLENIQRHPFKICQITSLLCLKFSSTFPSYSK